jgi:hypothetical protein
LQLKKLKLEQGFLQELHLVEEVEEVLQELNFLEVLQ